MPPLFLFGSGTSPALNVRQLTDYVLTTPMRRHTDGIFYPNDDNGCLEQEAGDSPACIRYYLQLIRDDIASYQKRKTPDVTYEDLANICVQLNKETGSRRNAALFPYQQNLIERITAKFPKFDFRKGDFGSICWAAMDYIQWAVFHALRCCQKQPTALRSFVDTFVHNISSASFVTLNHDCFLEKILGANASLGFRSHKKGAEFFDPDELAITRKIRVLKLHGSIDWFWHADSGKFRRLSKFDSFEIDGAPTLLAGTVSKLEAYNFSIFPWLWAEFQNRLRLTRRIVVSGYGFKDIGVTVRLADWLDHYPDARMVIIHPEPAILMDETKNETLDGVARFFHRAIGTVCSPATETETSNVKIIFLPIRFEDASTTTWAPWLKRFLSG